MSGTPSTPSSADAAEQPSAPALRIDRGPRAAAQSPVPADEAERHPAPALHIDLGREAGAARLRAVADAASGAAGAQSPEALAAVLRRACARALPCDGFRFATFDAAAGALRYHTSFPALATGDDEMGWRAVRARRPLRVRPRGGSPGVLSAPVLAGGEALGVLVAVRNGAGFSTDDVQVMEALAGVAASALARLRMADDHRAAVEALAGSEARFRGMYEQFPLSVQIFTPDGRTVEVNRAWERLFGLRLEDTRDWNPLHEPQLAPLGDMLRRGFAGEALDLPASEFDTRRAFEEVGGAAAEPRWIQASARPVRAADGSVGEVIVVHQDVTDLKRAQAELQRANQALEQRVEARTRELAHANDALAAEVQQHRAAREELLQRTLELEVVFRALPDLYFRLADDGRILSYRADADNALYVPPELFLNRRMQEVLPPDVGAKFDEACARVRRTGQMAAMDYTLDGPDGEPRAYEARLVPLVPGELAAVVRDVTERVEAERALRAREEHFRRLIEHASDLVSIIGPDGTIRYESEAIERMYGYTVAEGIGTSAWDRVHPDDHARVSAALAGVAANPGMTGSAEFRYRARSGEWRFVEAVGKTLTDDARDGIVINTRDVTARRQAEEALRESEERYRALIENGHDIIVILDPETGRMRYQSPSTERVLGYAPRDVADRNVLELIHPDDQEASLAAIARAVAAPGTTHHAEYRFLHADGGWRHLETFGRTLLPDSAAQGLVFNTRDITDRKEAEDALRRSERHFRRLIENGQDSISIVDPAGVMTYMSPSSLPMLGYAPEELVGRSTFEFIHPDDQPLVGTEIARVFASPGTIGLVEYRFRHRDGSWRYLEAIGQTLNPDSAADGLVANTRDVTERRLSEEALRRATAEAEAANRAKSEFLSRMSHELRTPMNSILGFAQLLERGAPLEPHQQRGVQHILTAGRHLLRLINEVLDIARIESGRQQLSLEPVRLDAVLQEAVVLARPLAAQAGICLAADDGPAGTLFVRADRQRLVQVLLNLLSNAVKYNREDGEVRLEWEMVPAEDEGGARIRLRVRDTGVGIAPELVDQLFVPFARLGAEYSDVEGTGLGLALSQRLVEAMGGALVLEHSGGEGSSFAVELRLSRDPVEGLALRAAAAPAPEPRPCTPATLLYVEDNLANLSLVETILASRPGWKTIPALQGRLGTELAREHLPDVVLLDLHLPDVQGDEVLRRLRADRRTAGIPVVMISADATPRTIDRLRAQGADAYLTKPLDVDEFLSTIDRLLARPAAAA